MMKILWKRAQRAAAENSATGRNVEAKVMGAAAADAEAVVGAGDAIETIETVATVAVASTRTEIAIMARRA